MFIRYQTARTIGLSLFAAGIAVALTLYLTRDKPTPAPVSPPVASSGTSAPTPPISQANPSKQVAPADAREDQMQQVARTMLEGTASGGKLKDLFRGAGPKVNLYDDNADGRWDRAKVDWDRDDQDDEKLTVKEGVLERKDEKTQKLWVYVGGQWSEKKP